MANLKPSHAVSTAFQTSFRSCIHAPTFQRPPGSHSIDYNQLHSLLTLSSLHIRQYHSKLVLLITSIHRLQLRGFDRMSRLLLSITPFRYLGELLSSYSCIRISKANCEWF